MAAFDDFSALLLEEAKRFLEKIKESKDEDAKKAYKHSAVLIGISALEAYINGISQELVNFPTTPIHEKALLEEKEVELKNGEFIVTERLKIQRLTDRIQYLYFKHSKTYLTGESEAWWGPLKQSLKVRNGLVHPKEEISISQDDVEILLKSVIECLLRLSKIIYKKEYPFRNMGLQSRLTF
ncbi:hypothetical protein [Pontibacter oryzae]|uniref:RiboL-PSP-HEPN domain-containing protein n=1 Tax=Pontibacter oryzae TaxID=2304593 RepID=A0A399SHZ8_9BACT|nr:hypothetical protein [Pontibacter oryzae]RIJ42641.1 hypothetical protein D1627_01945 [Pontibacter oryzae]